MSTDLGRDWSLWPDDLKDAHFLVCSEIEGSGNLRPFADWLDAGKPLSDYLAQLLAGMIRDSWTGLRLEAKGRRGRRSFDEVDAHKWKQLELGAAVKRRIIATEDAGAGRVRDLIVGDVADEMSVSKATAWAALRYLDEQLQVDPSGVWLLALSLQSKRD